MKIEPPLPHRTSIEPIFTFNANVADKSSGQAVKGIVSGLTLDGCLFQSPVSFSVGTILRLDLALSGHRIEVSAIVRQISPARSIRLEFFALDSVESLQAMQQWLVYNATPLPSKK